MPVVLRTTDGGGTWTPLTLPAAAYPASVDFLTTGAGWIASAEGTVFATTDGGSTWAAEDSGIAEGLRALSAVSPTDVWAAGAGADIVRRARP